MFVTAKEVCNVSSFKKSTLYKYIKAGAFPPPVSFGCRRVAWLRSEVGEWCRAVVRGDDLRAAVSAMVAKRKEVAE